MTDCNKSQNLFHKGIVGFTLIELVTSITILIIFAAISILNFNIYIKKAEYSALQQILRNLMNAEDIYFMEKERFFPDIISINIPKGVSKRIDPLKYTFPSGHKHHYIIGGNNLDPQIQSYWIEVRCDYDFNGNGLADRIRFTTLHKNGSPISYRAFHQFQ